MTGQNKNELAFNMPFSGFAGANFINCFASTYMVVEKFPVTDATAKTQENIFFLFDTMCGRSSLRLRFDGELTEMQKLIGETNDDFCGTDYTVDFLFGFAGYDYRKVTDSATFRAAIVASIDAGKPVLAQVKPSVGNGRFRVITGYDGDALLGPDYTKAQRKPERAPTFDELEVLYVFGDKIAARYTLKHGLERIRRVMQYNADEKLWDGYITKMGLYTSDSLRKADLDEKKARMKRVADTMWHTFNTHNFAEVFRRARDAGTMFDGISDMKRLREEPAFAEMRNRVSAACYGYTHDLAWALIGLEECADWSKHAAGYFGEMIELTLKKIAQNDAEVLAHITRAIEVLQ